MLYGKPYQMKSMFSFLMVLQSNPGCHPRDIIVTCRFHVGSKSLTRHVTERIKPLIHAFGHIHDEKGNQELQHQT